MKCQELNNQLASMNDITGLTPEMHRHIETCASCRKAYDKTESLLAFIAEEKSARVSPFVKTRVMAQIENPPVKPKPLKPAFVTAMSVMLLVLGFFSGGIFQNHGELASDRTEVIASDYYFSDNPGAQLEEIWINTYQDE